MYQPIITWEQWEQMSAEERRKQFKVPVVKRCPSFLPDGSGAADELVERTERAFESSRESQMLAEEINY